MDFWCGEEPINIFSINFFCYSYSITAKNTFRFLLSGTQSTVLYFEIHWALTLHVCFFIRVRSGKKEKLQVVTSFLQSQTLCSTKLSTDFFEWRCHSTALPRIKSFGNFDFSFCSLHYSTDRPRILNSAACWKIAFGEMAVLVFLSKFCDIFWSIIFLTMSTKNIAGRCTSCFSIDFKIGPKSLFSSIVFAVVQNHHL